MPDLSGIYGCVACHERFDSPQELRGHLEYVHRHQFAELGIPQ
ncbi:MAG TPA: hypothetical protein VNZ52_02870 [Candidatus Thermoplasmatota archaeon]|nr:hypothetical protein [Candidatus Thermoplasmatota archaeon]